VILVDSSIFMYAAGREHPHRAASVGFLSKVADGTVRAAIDAEILQEILHRYTSIKRWVEGRVVYDSARILLPEVLPVTAEVIDCARRLLDGPGGVGARDAVHAGVVEVYGLKGICSFDRDFDRIRGMRRVEP
jgi:predicted nucleic acid-binding protein